MRNVVLAAVLLLSSASFAGAVTQINARDHTCGEIAQIIRQEKKVFVRVGIGGRSFRYPPARCGPGDKRETTNLRDAEGKQCLLDYACVYDPESLYNFR
ncbi:hypothetical protein ATY81_05030 [Rhizobium sp. R72]|uniref:hypothetical protein n=1 Tax=unclassified Rhizobium TaxID=2613769 RepID=UPI000B531C5B|nr:MULTISPECIES: hypothetical protein [unclassified Rhizobium]OWW05306.1 hypothetical protein ATY81_05030 [Rhizobium sp. R72]OWW06363.1 hypothetical protein ATY80_05030 [Rhizobium sp. R711]